MRLQGAVAERGREFEGLLARRHGAVGVTRHPAYLGYPRQHQSQPGPIVERPGQDLGLAQQGEAPPILSQSAQRAIDSEAELDGQPPGVAVVGQVRERLEGLVERGTASRNAARSSALAPACWQ